MAAKRVDRFPVSAAVEVRWVDSMATHGWQNSVTDTKMEIVSVGHLLERRKDRLVMAMSRSHYQVGDIMEIPASAVKRVRRLK